MQDPVVGGYTPEKVALRRAIGLANDVEREIRLVLPRPGGAGAVAVDAAHHRLRPELQERDGDYDPARAKALLDMYGYVDRDGDGWRELPDGTPLVHREARRSPSSLAAQFDDAVEEGHGRDRHPHREFRSRSGPRT